MAAAQPGGEAKAPTSYYEQLADMNCHPLNEDTLIRIERNDPEIDGLRLSAEWQKSGSRVGQAIGGSRDLGGPVKKPILCELARGLSFNRSIEIMDIVVGRDRLDIIEILAPFIKHNSNLRILGLNGLEFFSMNLLSSVLENRTSNIEHLSLRSIRLEYADITILCEVVVKNRLRSLILDFLSAAPSLRALLLTLSHPDCQLEALGLFRCNVRKDAVQNVVQISAVNTSLLHLDLSWSYLTTRAWSAFFTFLRDTLVVLEVLKLDQCNIVDEGITELITILTTNTRLREVHGLMCYAKTVWDYCSRMLCSKTCIDSTFWSNHTIEVFDMDTWYGQDEDGGSVVDDARIDDVRSSLTMNENENKAEVSQIKIIQAHFSGPNADVSIFTRMPETILPFAIEWIGRTRVGLPLMYLVVQDLPTLFHTCHGPHCGERKRKIDATMLVQENSNYK